MMKIKADKKESWRYRIHQFWRGLNAKTLNQEQQALVRGQLSAAEWRLFQTFLANDQQHSFRVWRQLREAGIEDTILLRAGLLHDIGKTRANVGLVGRTWIVLGQAFWPKTAARWGEGDLEGARWWQKPFVVRSRHPEWGAVLLMEAGSAPELCDVVARHQDALSQSNLEKVMYDRLRLLQWADDLN